MVQKCKKSDIKENFTFCVNPRVNLTEKNVRSLKGISPFFASVLIDEREKKSLFSGRYLFEGNICRARNNGSRVSCTAVCKAFYFARLFSFSAEARITTGTGRRKFEAKCVRCSWLPFNYEINLFRTREYKCGSRSEMEKGKGKLWNIQKECGIDDFLPFLQVLWLK